MNSDGNELLPIGKNLSLIKTIDSSDADPRLALTKFIVLCDVSNPLYGDNGASTIFGPQKGASREMVEMLENGVVSFADLVHSMYGIDLNFPGAGAAGGLGAGAKFFFVFLRGDHSRACSPCELQCE